MFRWLTGKKTYIVAATTFVLAGLGATGVAIPAWLYSILAAAGLSTLRAGVNEGGNRK